MDSQNVFRDARSAAFAATAALAAGVLLDLYAVSRVSQDLRPGLAWHQIHFVVRLATIATFVMWFDRIYSNLPALGGRPEYGRIWAGLSFFAPPFCFFRPCQMMIEAGAPRHDGTRVAPGVVVGWWLMFLAAPAVLITALRLEGHDALIRLSLAHALNTAAGIAAIYLVRTLTQQQASTHSSLRRVAAAEQRRMRMMQQSVAAVSEESASTTATSRPEPSAWARNLPSSSPAPYAPSAAATTHAPFVERVPAVRTPAASAAVRRATSPTVRPAQRPTAGAPRAGLERQYADLRLRIDALRPSLWSDAIAWTAAVVAIATLLTGARQFMNIRTEASIAGSVQIVIGLLLVTSWIVVRRNRTSVEQREGGRWRTIAALGVIVAALNLLTLVGAFR